MTSVGITVWLRYFDQHTLVLADGGINAAWYWVEIPRGMVIRICILGWWGLQIVRSIWLYRHVEQVELIALPILLLLSLWEDWHLERIPQDRRNAYLVFRRNRRLARRVIFTLAATTVSISALNNPFPVVNIISYVFFWLYGYVNDALLPSWPTWRTNRASFRARKRGFSSER